MISIEIGTGMALFMFLFIGTYAAYAVLKPIVHGLAKVLRFFWNHFTRRGP